MKDQELNLAIGQHLRAVRTARGFKQADLADNIGVAFQQIQKYENGSNRLSVAVLMRLCFFMEIDPGEFVNGINDGSAANLSDDAASLARNIKQIKDQSVRNNLSALIRSLATAAKREDESLSV